MTLWLPKIIPVHFGLNTEIQTATQTEYFGSRWTFEFYRKTGRSSPILSSLCIQDRYHRLIAVRWKVPTFLAWTIIFYCFPVCVTLSKLLDPKTVRNDLKHYRRSFSFRETCTDAFDFWYFWIYGQESNSNSFFFREKIISTPVETLKISPQMIFSAWNN